MKKKKPLDYRIPNRFIFDERFSKRLCFVQKMLNVYEIVSENVLNNSFECMQPQVQQCIAYVYTAHG